MTSTNVKILSATAGIGAMVAMGALTVATSSQAEPSTPGPVPTVEATTGETSTESSVAPTTPTTTVAVPSIEGPAPLPPEQQDAL